MPQDYKSIALAIIGRYTYRISGVDTEALGKNLALQLFSLMPAILQIFDLLKSDDKMWTGYYLVKSLPDANLKQLALYKEGNSLLKAIYQRLNPYSAFWGEDKDGFVIAKRRIESAAKQTATLTNYDPRAYRKLFDFEMPANGKSQICWELPVEGDGFISYNRNDETVDGLDQIGTYQTIQAILTIAKTMRGKTMNGQPCPILEIGDISRAGGLDTSVHETHEDGKAFDMRPLRNDGQITKKAFTWKQVPPYHRAWTCEVIRTILRLYSGSIIYFNDEEIYKDPEFRGKVVRYGVDGAPESHDNHLHVILPGGQRGEKES